MLFASIVITGCALIALNIFFNSVAEDLESKPNASSVNVGARFGRFVVLTLSHA